MPHTNVYFEVTDEETVNVERFTYEEFLGVGGEFEGSRGSIASFGPPHPGGVTFKPGPGHEQIFATLWSRISKLKGKLAIRVAADQPGVRDRYIQTIPLPQG